MIVGHLPKSQRTNPIVQIKHVETKNKIHCKPETDCQEQELFSLPDYELPRPSYYMLQLLGMWIPSNAGFMKNVYYRVLIPVIWLYSVVAICGRYFLDNKDFRWGRLLNSISAVFVMGTPYMVAHYYFHFGCYGQIISLVSSEDRKTYSSIRKLTKFYSWLSIFIWVVVFVFFFFHHRTECLKTFYMVSYVIVLLYCTGWWSAWLCVYSFICSAHKIQIEQYVYQMKEKYGYSTRTIEAEETCIQELIEKFTIIRNCISQSQKDFEKIVSLSVTCFLVDSIMFSVAYWKDDTKEFPLWQYAVGISFDFVGIMFKLYPAAVVNQTLHEIVRVSGEHCYPDIDIGETPKQRFIFYQFLFMREQDLGMQILGVKITSKLTVGVFVTIATLALTFLHYVVPFLKRLGSL